jgi:hypothetical protein
MSLALGLSLIGLGILMCIGLKWTRPEASSSVGGHEEAMSGGMTASAVLAVILAASCSSDRRVAIMSWPEYRARSVQWPYVREFDTPRGSLLYYGAQHTYSPRDHQVEQIVRLWTSFEPTMAFNEGGNPPVEPTLEAAVEKYGEAGLVRFLAACDDIPVASLDPDRAQEVAHLRARFSAADVKLFFVLRAVAQFADRKGPAAVDAELERVLAIFNGSPGLGVAPRSISEVSIAFEQRFPGSGGYQATPLRWFDPTRADTFLNRVSRASSDYRDQAIVSTLGMSVADGQRVFAVIGGSHVVMQENALGAVLGVRGHRPGSSLRRTRPPDRRCG